MYFPGVQDRNKNMKSAIVVRSRHKTLFLFGFLFGYLFGSTDFATASERIRSFSTESFAVAIGAEYISQLDRRGVITYGSYQAFPIYSVDLFHPDLQLVGSTLNWKSAIGESALYRLRLNPDAANDSPLYETGEKLEDRVRRASASEVEAFLELNPTSWLETSFNLGTGFGGYTGTYGEVSIRVKLGRFFERARGHLLEPSLTASVGGGASGHNEYYYGSGAATGLSYSTVGVSFVSPGIVDHFYPWFKIYRSSLIGDSRNASYVRLDEREHWTFLILAAKRVW